MAYTITDDFGFETVETQAELFDGLIMRGFTPIDALIAIGELVKNALDDSYGPTERTNQP